MLPVAVTLAAAAAAALFAANQTTSTSLPKRQRPVNSRETPIDRLARVDGKTQSRRGGGGGYDPDCTLLRRPASPRQQAATAKRPPKRLLAGRTEPGGDAQRRIVCGIAPNGAAEAPLSQEKVPSAGPAFRLHGPRGRTPVGKAPS
eukprot:359703-Chlamydomonas_euryale.AAC.1